MPGASIEGKNMVLCLYISFALVATVALVWNPFRVCGLDYYEYKYIDLTTMNINIYIYEKININKSSASSIMP